MTLTLTLISAAIPLFMAMTTVDALLQGIQNIAVPLGTGRALKVLADIRIRLTMSVWHASLLSAFLRLH